MKKLLLLLSLLLATNAWAEVKTLECEYTFAVNKDTNKTYKNTYTFDPEMPNGECLDFTGEVLPVEVTVFPNYYRLTYNWMNSRGTKVSVKFMADISRVDLSSTFKRDLLLTNSTRTDTGQCKFIEIEETKKLF